MISGKTGHQLKFWILQKMSEMLKTATWHQEKFGGFIANVFWFTISSENYFHKHDIYNLIYMNIHVKRQLLQSNVKSVENISRKNKNHKTCAKKSTYFFCSYSEISTFQTSFIKSETCMAICWDLSKYKSNEWLLEKLAIS